MSSEHFPIENGLFHVTNRGVDRWNIALDDHDRKTWLRLLDRNATRRGRRVFAFALLDNHFHLYLRTPHGNLSTGMRDFEGGYATLFNRRHDREGQLDGKTGQVQYCSARQLPPPPTPRRWKHD